MPSLATWMLFGLVIPQLGSDERSLRQARFFPSDQQPTDGREFFQIAKPSELGDHAVVSALTHAGQVNAVVITSGRSTKDLNMRLDAEPRCQRLSEHRFACELGNGAGTATVRTCNTHVLIASEAFPNGMSRLSGFCPQTASEAPPSQSTSPPQPRPWWQAVLVGAGLIATMAITVLIRRRRS